MKKKLENRREFLKKVCPTIAFAFFGLSFLEACSTGDDSNNDNSAGNDQNGGSDNNDNNDPLGFSSSGSIFTIDLTHPNFSNLSSVGGWMNGYSIGLSMLFLRISSNHIRLIQTFALTKELKTNGHYNLEIFSDVLIIITLLIAPVKPLARFHVILQI